MKKAKILIGMVAILLFVSNYAFGQTQCLYWVSSASLSAGDQVLFDKMTEWGFEVTAMASTEVEWMMEEEILAYDFMLASESIDSGGLKTIKTIPIPFVNMEGWCVKPGAMDWQADRDIDNYTPEPVKIVDDTDHPLAAGFDKADGFAGQPTLDGLAWVRQHSPDEYAAVRWLNEHVTDTSVILEATGGSFTEYGRVSSRTGLPTLLGWGGHELQWRGNYEEPGRREPDINAIYSSLDTQHVLTLLEKYGITYVYVGSLERGKYNPAALAKFDRFMDVAFQQGSVTIYERRPSARE